MIVATGNERIVQLNPLVYLNVIHKAQHCSKTTLLTYFGELTEFQCE